MRNPGKSETWTMHRVFGLQEAGRFRSSIQELVRHPITEGEGLTRAVLSSYHIFFYDTKPLI